MVEFVTIVMKGHTNRTIPAMIETAILCRVDIFYNLLFFFFLVI
jgi:hypothetical protein